MVARLQTQYKETIAPALQEQLKFKSAMRVPRIEKIVVNMGLGGRALANKKVIEHATDDMMKITGQKALVTKARKSIAGFKLREGWPIGCKVTLRGERMYEFFDRLISVAIPRVRDFRGLSPKAFDGRGNYTMGLTEQIVFPEIDYDKIDEIRGMDITIVTSARTNEEGLALLKMFGFPLREK